MPEVKLNELDKIIDENIEKWVARHLKSGRVVRQVEAGRVYFYTSKMVDNQFLLRPDESGRVRELVGSAIARAKALAPVHVHWFEVNTNHIHAGISAISDVPAHVSNVSLFKRNCHSVIAKGLNRMYGRTGYAFGDRAFMAPCLDDGAVWEKFLYSVTNRVRTIW